MIYPITAIKCKNNARTVERIIGLRLLKKGELGSSKYRLKI